MSRSSYSGVLKTVRFNWPWYALALGVNLVLLAAAPSLPASWRLLTLGAVCIADAWLFASLAVSHWIYDRSGIARGAWLDRAVASAPSTIAVMHAGQDEASGVVSQRFPLARIARLDFFDPALTKEGSLLRARAAAGPSGATPIPWNAFPLDPGSLDLVCIVFAAHELRDASRLGAFFGEVRRVLDPRGTVIVVEHLRDACNAAAYGPGALHFLPRGRWMQAFADSGLRVREERTHTPFVHAFLLERGS